MASSPPSIGKAPSIPGRIGLALLLVGTIAVMAESQSPSGDYSAETAAAASGVRVPAGAVPAAVDFPQVGASGDMIGFSHSDSSGTQTITLVHTKKSWMAVYHIDRSGSLRLVSSRPIDADFSLQLNATSPLPEEIRQIGRR